MLWFSLRERLRRRRLHASGRPVVGTVTAIGEVIGGEGDVSYEIQYAYDVGGRRFETAIGDFTFEAVRAIAVGDPVDLRVDPIEPERSAWV